MLPGLCISTQLLTFIYLEFIVYQKIAFTFFSLSYRQSHEVGMTVLVLQMKTLRLRHSVICSKSQSCN